MVLLAIVPLSAEEPQRVEGTWTGTWVKVNEGANPWLKEEFTLVLQQDNQTCTGTLAWRRIEGFGPRSKKREVGQEAPVEGTLVGGKLSLKIGKNGFGWLEAVVNGESLSGLAGFQTTRPYTLTGTRSK